MSEDQRSPSPASEPAGGDRLSGKFVAWVSAVGDRFRTGAELAVAEAKLALSTFIMLMFVAMIAAGALLFAWALLLFALAQYPLSMGVSPAMTALLFCGLHIVLALLLWRLASSMARNLEFSETRRLLRDTALGTEPEDGH